MRLLERALWPAYKWRLRRLRRRLEGAFANDTSAPGFPCTSPSSGQCAAVSTVLHFALGAEYASAQIDGLSHWFNRVHVGSSSLDVDLTGDQFGRPAIQQALSGTLYEGTRHRNPHELRAETLERAAKLADRAGLKRVRDKIMEELNSRRASEEVHSIGIASRTG